MTDALKTVVPRYHGNDRRHGGYSRTDNKMCEVFVTRLVPETTASDVNNNNNNNMYLKSSIQTSSIDYIKENIHITLNISSNIPIQ